MAGRIKPLCNWGKGYSRKLPIAMIAGMFVVDAEVELVDDDMLVSPLQAVRRRMRSVRQNRYGVRFITFIPSLARLYLSIRRRFRRGQYHQSRFVWSVLA